MGTIKRRHVGVSVFRDTFDRMSEKDSAPHKVSKEVREKQTKGYSEADYAAALDRATRRLDQEPSEPGPRSPKRSARRGRAG